jgi:hypothetical protein
MKSQQEPDYFHLVGANPAEKGAIECGTPTAPPGPAVTAAGWLIAVWCVGFAVVNLAYLATGHFDDGEYAEYAAGIAGMSWLVLIVKLVGAAVAVMAVYRVPRFCSPRLLGLTLWGAAALLVLYSAGNLVQLAGMLTGVMGSREDITLLGLGYVAFFMLGAVGYGMLAVSFSRRYTLTKPTAILGVLGAPLFLAVILVAIPLLLAQLDLLPS